MNDTSRLLKESLAWRDEDRSGGGVGSVPSPSPIAGATTGMA